MRPSGVATAAGRADEPKQEHWSHQGLDVHAMFQLPRHLRVESDVCHLLQRPTDAVCEDGIASSQLFGRGLYDVGTGHHQRRPEVLLVVSI